MENRIINNCKLRVKAIYDTFDASHDWQHIERVLQNAERIMAVEPADPFIVELAVLLHDVSDPKYTKNGIDPEKDILESLGLPEEQSRHIAQIIREVSFKGGNGEEPSSIEAKVVQDADRLDAMGAVGIARTFAYGGAKGRKLYDWDEKPRSGMTEQEYRNKPTSSATHFYEKLLLLKNRMSTETGRHIADERHQFMLSFLEQLKKETDGNA